MGVLTPWTESRQGKLQTGASGRKGRMCGEMNDSVQQCEDFVLVPSGIHSLKHIIPTSSLLPKMSGGKQLKIKLHRMQTVLWETFSFQKWLLQVTLFRANVTD